LLAPSVEQVMRLTAEDVRGWMLGHTERAPIEVAVVGDIALRDAARVIASTLGTLPMREPPSAEWNKDRRTLAPAAMPARADITDPAISRGGIALAGFVGCELAQTRDHRALRTIAEILSQRAADNAGGGQSHTKAQGSGRAARAVRFSANPALAYPSMAAVMSATETDGSAEGGAGALRAMDEAIDDLRQNPPTLEELAGATATLSAQAEAFEDDARAWSTLLARCLSRGVEPDDLTGGAAFYRELTSEAVMQTLWRYSSPERRFTILLHGPAAEPGVPKDARVEDGAAPPNGGEGKGQPKEP
jgi:predicted Zn-dependent peptidase